MPAYSFQERFVPMVLDGSKCHTVRNRRKNPAKVGDTLYLYYGLRTKWVKKLREETCTATHSLSISKSTGIVLYERLLDKVEMEMAKFVVDSRLPEFIVLTEQECDVFAWHDGFRLEGSTPFAPHGSFDLMMRFWSQTHELPWVGDIIYWQPKQLQP